MNAGHWFAPAKESAGVAYEADQDAAQIRRAIGALLGAEATLTLTRSMMVICANRTTAAEAHDKLEGIAGELANVIQGLQTNIRELKIESDALNAKCDKYGGV